MESKFQKKTLSKIDYSTIDKRMSSTFTTSMFPSRPIDRKLPPVTRNFTKRNLVKSKQPNQQTIQGAVQTQFKKESKVLEQKVGQGIVGWDSPKDYLNEIKELNLLGQEKCLDLARYEIKLNENVQTNVERIEGLFALAEKWILVLRRALSFSKLKKTKSDKLSEEVRIWKELSQKFDELEYQFKNTKTASLVELMKHCLKTHPERRALVEEFSKLKDSVAALTIPAKKLYFCLEECLAGQIVQLEQNQDIVESFCLLKNILTTFGVVAEQHPLLVDRLYFIYKKMAELMMNKLLAAPLYPRELANISGLKQRYGLIDKALSFYSNLIPLLESTSDCNILLQEAQYTRLILSYFQYLYIRKEVLEFSKLFAHRFEFNIYCVQNSHHWLKYMEQVHNSMALMHFQP